MENKKGVIGIVGTVLLVVMVIVISSPSNSADGDVVENPYEKIMYELNDSINVVARNNERMAVIDSDVDGYRDELRGMIDSYELLKGDMERNLEGLERLSDVVDRTQKDSEDVGTRLNELRDNVKVNEEKFVYENSGIRISPIFVLMFLLVNCVVWIQMSSYYKKRYV